MQGFDNTSSFMDEQPKPGLLVKWQAPDGSLHRVRLQRNTLTGLFHLTDLAELMAPSLRDLPWLEYASIVTQGPDGDLYLDDALLEHAANSFGGSATFWVRVVCPSHLAEAHPYQQPQPQYQPQYQQQQQHQQYQQQPLPQYQQQQQHQQPLPEFLNNAAAAAPLQQTPDFLSMQPPQAQPQHQQETQAQATASWDWMSLQLEQGQDDEGVLPGSPVWSPLSLEASPKHEFPSSIMGGGWKENASWAPNA